MRQSITIILGILLIVGLNGCASEEPPLGEPAPEPAAELPPPVAAEVAPADDEPTDQELAVAEDFEQEVAVAINAGNYPAQLDTLEQEIGSDGE